MTFVLLVSEEEPQISKPYQGLIQTVPKKKMSNNLPGATVNIAPVDPSAGPEEERPVYKPEGWFHWGFRMMYNSLFFVANSVSYTAHGAVGHSKGDPKKYDAGYWSAPTVSNN